jgi:hypothetical protein
LADAVGIVLIALVVALQKFRKDAATAPPSESFS